jgi:hypothetical protein
MTPRCKYSGETCGEKVIWMKVAMVKVKGVKVKRRSKIQ